MKFTVRQARTYAGMTQQEMCKKLGIDRGTYSKIEKNPQLATIGQINMISRVTGIPVDSFFLDYNFTNVKSMPDDSPERTA